MSIKYSVLIFVMIFAGCQKKDVIKEPKSLKGKRAEYEQLLAQHSEIPDPQVGFEIESVRRNLADSQSIEIIYKPVKKVSISVQQLKASYIADMEMLGWECIAEFDGPTTQLVFQKAGRKLLSTIEISSHLQIKIVVYTKK